MPATIQSTLAIVPEMSAMQVIQVGHKRWAAIPVAPIVLMIVLFGILGCSEKSSEASAATANTKSSSSAPGGSRGGRSIVLAAADIGAVERKDINSSIEVTGTLRPIDNIAIRARIEGPLDGVYVREGQHVSVGQLLARFESLSQQSSSASAQAGLVAAESELSTSTWNREQADELFKKGAIPERDFRAAQQEEKTAQARLSAAQALVRSTGLTERDTRVVAPVSGVIDTKAVEMGEHVSKGAVLFTIVRNTTLELAAAVPERNASLVRVGQKVQFASDGRSFTGIVARMSPTIDAANRTITIYVDIPNTTGALKGGAFATGKIVAQTVTNTLTIPFSALRQNADGSRYFVYRVVDGKVAETDISVGIVNDRDQIVQVTDGLAEADQVIVGNLGTLANGMQVQIIGRDSTKRR